MTDMMRALVFEGPNRMNLRQIPRPRPGPGEVLIRVHATAICGTDIRIFTGRKTREIRHGHPIGHECAGTVAAVGI
ncbi:MAG TPA: alcohol dehydrogenase catalytic domain-containing protein, partial [Phycisphaerae bacterium]|nr:alcohol dehydrogenase catalytic domain-containing protein [Phycisphaerae bacterium]